MPKSITFGTGTPSCSVTRMFDGLMSRWMIPFWCACWIAWQTCDEQVEPLRRVESWSWSQYSVIGMPAHQLHHEVRPARLGRAGIEHLGDVRMVHQRQRLPLGLEAGDHLLRVHAELDDLERDAAPDRLALLGHPDRAEAAFADLLEQLVAADPSAARRARRPLAAEERAARGGRVGG